jgi:hypothetical protein
MRFRLAVPPPSDVGDPPALLELDKVEHDGLGLVEILELDRSACLARRNVLRGDIECLDIPVAGIDEWIARKRGGLAAIRGILSVLDDEPRQPRLSREITAVIGSSLYSEDLMATA